MALHRIDIDQIHGNRGSAVIVNDELRFLHSIPVDRDAPEVLMGKQGRAENHLTPGELARAGDWVDPMIHQYRNFLAALRDEEPVRVGLVENRGAVAVITGLYESARTGRPVALSTLVESR